MWFLKAMRSKYFIPFCFILAFVLRLLWVILIDARPATDCRVYYDIAVDIAAGKGYHHLGEPSAYRPIGYPGFLALIFTMFGPSVTAAKVANIVLYLGVLFFSYRLAKNLFQSELTGRVTLFLLAIYPNHIAYCSLLATEIFFLFLLVLGIFLFIHAKDRLLFGFVSGVVFGVASLVRPPAMLVPVVLFLAYSVTKDKKKKVLKDAILFLIVIVSLVLTVLPWSIRNYRAFKQFVFISTNGGVNLLIGNNPYATGSYIFSDKISSMIKDASGEYERNKKAGTLAVKYMVGHPWKTICLWPKKLWYLYGKDVEGFSWGRERFGPKAESWIYALQVFAQGFYMFIGACFLLSFYVLCTERSTRPCPLLGLWVMGYFTLVHLPVFGDSRFHFPVIPWVVMYIAALVDRYSNSAMILKWKKKMMRNKDKTVRFTSFMGD